MITKIVRKCTGRRRKRLYVKDVATIIMFSIGAAFIIFFRWRNRFEPTPDRFKEDVYSQCQLSSSPMNISEDVYLLIHYADDEGGLHLQMATSYLLLQNLQQLSIEQQTRTHVVIFLSENYSNATCVRLERWFRSIYTPYTATTQIIRTKNDSQVSREWLINYTKSHNDILFFLEDDYIFEADMLSDTIEFFASHNPCFVSQTDHSDRCRLDVDDGLGHLLVPGRTRLWRSAPFTILSYACRLRTFLAFADLLRSDAQTRAVGEMEVFYCAIPSYSARIETLLLPNEINSTVSGDMTIYYKDWWSMARRALAEAQKLDVFPCSKINERDLFA